MLMLMLFDVNVKRIRFTTLVFELQGTTGYAMSVFTHLLHPMPQQVGRTDGHILNHEMSRQQPQFPG